jgi:preprotein translocase subunit SecB
MESKTSIESGFRVHNILLMDTTFKRETTLTLEPEKLDQNVNVDVLTQIEGNYIIVQEHLSFSRNVKGVELPEVSAEITMVGVFEKFGDSELNIKAFGDINGPAIIFPYIREHLTSLAAKAGLGLIFIPPGNFTKKTE